MIKLPIIEFRIFLGIYMFTVTITPDNVTFKAVEGETLLDSGLKLKLNLPHSCKSGACGMCKTKVVSGSIDLDVYNNMTLTDAEKDSGYTLLCKAHARSDVTLDIPTLMQGFPIKMLPSKVESIEKIHNTAIITLKLPANQKFEFYPGQYIEIMLKGKTRSYSLANSPQQANQLMLHVKYHPQGAFSELVWNELKADSILRFKGPLGNFKLQNSTRPILMVCTGTGFAPLKAILDDMLLNENNREIHLYWGNRSKDDFYLQSALQIWQAKLNLKITLCLSHGTEDGFQPGYVTKALEADYIDLSAYELYACGNFNMISDVFSLATMKLHLLKQNFFSDAFTPAAG